MTRASTHKMTIFHCWWPIRHGNAVILLWLPVLLEGEVLPSRFRFCCWTVLTHCTAHRGEQALLVLGVTLQPHNLTAPPGALSSAPPWSQSWPCPQKMGEQQRGRTAKRGTNVLQSARQIFPHSTFICVMPPTPSLFLIENQRGLHTFIWLKMQGYSQ